jgi:hypothetical protein
VIDDPRSNTRDQLLSIVLGAARGERAPDRSGPERPEPDDQGC